MRVLEHIAGILVGVGLALQISSLLVLRLFTYLFYASIGLLAVSVGGCGVAWLMPNRDYRRVTLVITLTLYSLLPGLVLTPASALPVVMVQWLLVVIIIAGIWGVAGKKSRGCAAMTLSVSILQGGYTLLFIGNVYTAGIVCLAIGSVGLLISYYYNRLQK